MRKIKIFNDAGKDAWAEGIFHGWGVDYEELNNGVGSFTVAIVERKDSDVIELMSISSIQFINE